MLYPLTPSQRMLLKYAPGDESHHWTLVSPAGMDGRDNVVWNVQCACGAEAQLTSGQFKRPKSCKECKAGRGDHAPPRGVRRLVDD